MLSIWDCVIVRHTAIAVAMEMILLRYWETQIALSLVVLQHICRYFESKFNSLANELDDYNKTTFVIILNIIKFA